MFYWRFFCFFYDPTVREINYSSIKKFFKLYEGQKRKRKWGLPRNNKIVGSCCLHSITSLTVDHKAQEKQIVIDDIAAEVWTSVRNSRFCLLSAFQITHKCFFFMASPVGILLARVLRNVVPKLLTPAAPTEYILRVLEYLEYSQYNMPSEIKAFVKMNFGQMIV